jgi:hypothetical protein
MTNFNHDYKMSKMSVESSPPWPQDKSLIMEPPHHVMTNSVTTPTHVYFEFSALKCYYIIIWFHNSIDFMCR